MACSVCARLIAEVASHKAADQISRDSEFTFETAYDAIFPVLYEDATLAPCEHDETLEMSQCLTDEQFVHLVRAAFHNNFDEEAWMAQEHCHACANCQNEVNVGYSFGVSYQERDEENQLFDPEDDEYDNDEGDDDEEDDDDDDDCPIFAWCN